MVSLLIMLCCHALTGRIRAGLYHPHLVRQEADLRVFREDEGFALNPDMDYDAVPALSAEVREKLKRVRPTSIVGACLMVRIRELMGAFAGCSQTDGGRGSDIHCVASAVCETAGDTVESDNCAGERGRCPLKFRTRIVGLAYMPSI